MYRSINVLIWVLKINDISTVKKIIVNYLLINPKLNFKK